MGLISSHFFLRLRHGRHPWRDLAPISRAKEQSVNEISRLSAQIQTASIFKHQQAGNMPHPRYHNRPRERKFGIIVKCPIIINSITFMFGYLQRMKAYAQPIMVLMFVLSHDGSKGPIPLFYACLAVSCRSVTRMLSVL